MKSQYRSVVRHGIAPIEFLMFLPVVIAFAAMTMYIIRIHEAKQRSTLNAEISAVEEAVIAAQEKRLADLPGYSGTDSADLAQLVAAFPRKPLDIKAGIAVGESEVDSGEGVYGGIKAAGAANAKIEFLSHAWESDVLPFPTRRNQQPPLTLPQSVRGIASNLVDVQQFAKLASLGSGISGGFSGSAEGLARTQQAAIQTGKRELEKLNKSIDQMERKLTELKRDPITNEVEIREIEAKLRQASSQRDRLKGML
ncbi:hypothetical protein SH528x_000083 [Novipirellula sp. SH528]|uniref:hypothetical protein n=1 Tax=Novipirellula sp. SH528 TaxID=3454466 RepID=UPI003F9EEDED